MCRLLPYNIGQALSADLRLHSLERFLTSSYESQSWNGYRQGWEIESMVFI
jgi:hypothetical protein